MKKTITIIGSGISGLICAFKCSNEGYDVKIISKGTRPNNKFYHSKYHSSTWDGEVGRFFTTFEGHPYIGDSKMYHNMKDAFKTKISKGGWLGKSIPSYDKQESDWLEKRWDANEDRDSFSDKFEFYVNSNKFSISQWSKFNVDYPALFVGTNFYEKKILRLYTSRNRLDFSIELHTKYDALKKRLTLDDISENYPIFRESCNNGFFKGGIEAVGQSINIKKFCLNLITYLKEKGVEFIYDTEIKKINFNKQKKVESIESNETEFKDVNFVFCTGAYHKKELFENTPSYNKFGGVAGRWFLIPKPTHFEVPTKIHLQDRKSNGSFYPVVDFNFTPYYNSEKRKSYIAIGGGYVYSGNFPFDGIEEELNFINEINRKALEKILGSTYNRLFDRGEITLSNAVCHRSFSFDDTPVFDQMPTTEGGSMVITGGTNTGTATLAPFIADKVFKMIDSA